MAFGLDDWIYLAPPLQSLWITINYNNSQPIFSRTLLTWLPRTRPILVLSLSFLNLSLMLRPTVSRSVFLGMKHPSGANTRSLLLSDSCYDRRPVGQSWNGPIENTCVALQWIYMRTTEKTSLSLLLYSALHSNWSYPIVAYIFVASGMCLPCRCLVMGLHVSVYCMHTPDSRFTHIRFIYSCPWYEFIWAVR
jgi:hypothetical protein